MPPAFFVARLAHGGGTVRGLQTKKSWSEKGEERRALLGLREWDE
jgi:hypothetical protein